MKIIKIQVKQELKSSMTPLNSARRKLYNVSDVREKLMMAE
ncbi:hypothetical protein N9A78_00775 [Akkermansiaceae bacterium]|nr:hypothetical protein [Akkermansiaceae bacterium]